MMCFKRLLDLVTGRAAARREADRLEALADLDEVIADELDASATPNPNVRTLRQIVASRRERARAIRVAIGDA